MTSSRSSVSLTLASARGSTAGSVLWIAAVALVYFAAARLSLRLVFEPEGIAAIWPPEGIFLSAILLTRRELRVWLVAVLFCTDLAAELLAGTPPFVSAMYALALTGSATSSAWLLLRFVGRSITFGRVRDVIGFMLLAMLLCNAAMSMIAAAASLSLPDTTFWTSWKWWATSDGIGSLLVTPLVLSWVALARAGWGDWSAGRVVEAGALLVSLTIMIVIPAEHLTDQGDMSLLVAYLSFPLMLWAAMRFGTPGVSVALAMLAAIVIHSAVADQLAGVIAVQLFLAVVAVPSLIVAAAVTERGLAEEEILELNAHLEDRVAERTAELEATNRELEEFSYTISHDLRAPLRAISGFAHLLAENHGDSLGEDERHYVDRIMRATNRMGRLIDGVLELLRVGRGSPSVAMPLGEILADIAADLAAQVVEEGGELRLPEDPPPLIGDPVLLEEVFSGLIGNALAYHRSGVPPVVEVGWEFDDEGCVVRVQDNGIGIPADFHAKIFEAFQRLHADGEYIGTGIGLAIVKKAVTILGGTIWMDSVVGEGSTFYVRLPARAGRRAPGKRPAIR